eukprot:scaffold87473_cov19-Prasinocladus_malaysianus.AAC.2
MFAACLSGQAQTDVQGDAKVCRRRAILSVARTVSKLLGLCGHGYVWEHLDSRDGFSSSPRWTDERM